MKVLKPLIAATTLALAALPAMASFTISFGSAPEDFTAVADTFNSAAYNYTSFSGSAWMVKGANQGGLGNFVASPSGGGLVLAYDPVNGSSPKGRVFFIINVTDGFGSYFNLEYANAVGGNTTITVLDSTLSELEALDDNYLQAHDLATFSVGQTSVCQGLYPICDFQDAGSGSFSGTAYSVLFITDLSEDGTFVFDNLSFGDPQSNGVPEPAGLALAGLGLGAVAITRRRRR